MHLLSQFWTITTLRINYIYWGKTKFHHALVLFGGQKHAFEVPSSKEGSEIHCTQIHECKSRPPPPTGGEICMLTRDQYWSILINVDQYWSILIAGGEICLLTSDQYWSILINIDRRRRHMYFDLRSIMINIDQYWSIHEYKDRQNDHARH